ncbi:15882_t:CDS:2 [Cetraspora pellucida]|uniref:15882_t:CDS:1 n=1 Tax=Cetraspora pellucida TaxID=1433469 RepID=A0A9N8ZAB8_9GLOM|nr:15882_t:CDS:2 [Cetraspora pellucida]
MAVSFVLSGIFLPNDFNLLNASPFNYAWCAISGFLISLSSISNYGVALALSTELYISLGLSSSVTKRNDVKIRRLNIFLTVVMPILCISSSLITLALHHNPLFEVIDTSGICAVSRHSDYRFLLFMLRTVPEFLPIYPSCVLSVPVVRKVFRTYRLHESFALPWQSKISSSPSPMRSTRAGPPPKTASSIKPTIPRNVLLRMASWCCLLIISGIPMATIIVIQNIHYVIYDNDINILNYDFWNRNGITLHMCLSMVLFLLCFGTGEFATEQYGILWTKMLSFICCSPRRQMTHQIELEFIDHYSNGSTQHSSSSLPPSFIASPPIIYARSIPIEYTYVTPPVDKKYLTGARAGWVTSKAALCQQCQTTLKSDSGSKGTSTIDQPEIIRQTVSLCEDNGISSAGSTNGHVYITIPERAKLGS